MAPVSIQSSSNNKVNNNDDNNNRIIDEINKIVEDMNGGVANGLSLYSKEELLNGGGSLVQGCSWKKLSLHCKQSLISLALECKVKGMFIIAEKLLYYPKKAGYYKIWVERTMEEIREGVGS